MYFFLTEYLPTKKPVIHLRKDSQNIDFNSLLKTIIKNYYQVFDNNTLANIFETVLEQENDFLKEKRIRSLKHLIIDKKQSAGEKVVEYITQQLRLEEK